MFVTVLLLSPSDYRRLLATAWPSLPGAYTHSPGDPSSWLVGAACALGAPIRVEALRHA